LKSNYLSNFRVTSTNGTNELTVIQYTKPNNTVSVKKKYEDSITIFPILWCLLFTIFVVN